MYFETQTYSHDMEILASSANLVTFSATVLASNNVTADENGKKYIPAGSLIDAEGTLVTPIGDELTGTPIGVVYKTIDITKGDMPCAVVVEGYLIEERVLDGYSELAKSAVKIALPKITFRGI